VLEILQALHAVMAEVQLLQVYKRLKIFDLFDTVGLQSKDSKTLQTAKILKSTLSIYAIRTSGRRHLELRNLIFTEPKLFEVDQCIEVLDFLWFFFSRAFNETLDEIVMTLTLILLPPSSRLRSVSPTPWRPVILEIRFCTK
jgi:hypothetical protein